MVITLLTIKKLRGCGIPKSAVANRKRDAEERDKATATKGLFSVFK
jgi:hypothetical protein